MSDTVAGRSNGVVRDEVEEDRCFCIEPPLCLGVSPAVDAAGPPSHMCDKLSVRATNVLKELAMEITGEAPPKGPWFPPVDVLRKLTLQQLRGAKNCGPKTIDEILRWARSREVAIEATFYSGKSLPMWHEVVTEYTHGEFTAKEIWQALDRSVRRSNAKVLVAFQKLLMRIIRPNSEVGGVD